jgi:hypothetical protein
MNSGREAVGVKRRHVHTLVDQDGGDDGRGDDEGRPDGRLIAEGQTGEDGRRRAAGGTVANFLHRAVVGAGEVVGQAVDDDRQGNTDGRGEEGPPPSAGHVVHVEHSDDAKQTRLR